MRQLTIGNWTAADIAGANKEDAFGGCPRSRTRNQSRFERKKVNVIDRPASAFQNSDMKTILPVPILCGVMSIFAASFCLAQDAGEDEVIKGPQFGANYESRRNSARAMVSQ